MGGGKAELTPGGVFSFLLGRWRIERMVPGQAVMEGMLTVTEKLGGQATYNEQVAVRTTRGAEFLGSRRYDLMQSENGFVLCFAETGAVFEEVRFAANPGGSLHGEAEHLCGEDWYRSAYVFGPGPQFRVRHAVTGPRKDYVSVTTFQRTAS